jgi:hypothetical protein
VGPPYYLGPFFYPTQDHLVLRVVVVVECFSFLGWQINYEIIVFLDDASSCIKYVIYIGEWAVYQVGWLFTPPTNVTRKGLQP